MDYLSYLIENDIRLGSRKPLKIGRNSVSLSHLMLFDDLIFMGEVSLTNCSVIIQVIQKF